MTIFPIRRCLAGALALLYLVNPAMAQEPPAPRGPVLHCQIVQGGRTLELEAGPIQDPYSVPLQDINGRFLFKMVVVGTTQLVDYIKLYAYDNSGRQPVLVQYAKYLKPKSQATENDGALTGVQTVYSAWLEREMQYQCALIGAQP